MTHELPGRAGRHAAASSVASIALLLPLPASLHRTRPSRPVSAWSFCESFLVSGAERSSGLFEFEQKDPMEESPLARVFALAALLLALTGCGGSKAASPPRSLAAKCGSTSG